MQQQSSQECQDRLAQRRLSDSSCLYSSGVLFPAGGIGRVSLTHCLHELLIVLAPVNLPSAVECHGCACRRAALQGPGFAQGIYGLPYLQSNSQGDVAE